MRKGTAMEGFVREDGTIRPIEHYDDTELSGMIKTNTANISNLDSRLTAAEDDIDDLKTHGGVEDQTKADKVENATAGNLASLDAEGNLQDSGYKPSDLAALRAALPISVERTGTTNPTFSVTNASKSNLTTLVSELLEGKAYACVVSMIVNSYSPGGSTRQKYKAAGTISWEEKEIEVSSETRTVREVTLYVGFNRFVTMCVAGEDGWESPTWSYTWSYYRDSEDPFTIPETSGESDGDNQSGNQSNIDPEQQTIDPGNLAPNP